MNHSHKAKSQFFITDKSSFNNIKLIFGKHLPFLTEKKGPL